jgi:hypothetical protein
MPDQFTNNGFSEPAEDTVRPDSGVPVISNGMVPKKVFESYVISEARYSIGVYAHRLLIRLIESAQKYTYDIDFADSKVSRRVEVGQWGDAEIVLPVRSILYGEDDRNYDKAREAVEELMKKFIEYDDGETYRATQILNEVEMSRLKGRMIIRVNRNLWKAMLDFSKGYRTIDMETILRLRSSYSMRLYSLVATSTKPLTFTIQQLRDMWELNDKYKATKDFIRFTIDVAKEELDRTSQLSFDYTMNFSETDPANQGRRGRPSVTSITFTPRKRIQNAKTNDLRKQVSISMLIGAEAKDVLRNKFEFDDAGIRNNIAIFEIAQKNNELLPFLDRIAPVALRAKNPQGYVVASLRKHLIEMGVSEEDLQ